MLSFLTVVSPAMPPALLPVAVTLPLLMQSDMAVPSWLLCASMVKQDGYLAMVVPDTCSLSMVIHKHITIIKSLLFCQDALSEAYLPAHSQPYLQTDSKFQSALSFRRLSAVFREQQFSR